MLALTNGKLYTITDGIIDRGTLLIEGERIAFVGTEAAIPAEAKVIDLDGKTVLPGLIDASTRLGIHEESFGAIGYDEDEATAACTPQVAVIDAINPTDIALAEAAAAGITTVAVTPGVRNVIGGQIAVLKTAGPSLAEMVIEPRAGLRVNLAEASGRARSDAAAIFLRQLQAAKNYLEQRKPDDDKLEYDISLQVMTDVVQGKLPVFMQGVQAHDILNAIDIADEWGLQLVIERGLEAHLVVDAIKDSGYPLILGSIMGNRRGDTKPTSHKTAGIVAAAGITTALSTQHPATPAEHALVQAALAHREGMSEADTLAALTINPAKILGLDHRLGSLEAGKDADLVIMSGHPFSVFTQVEQVLINGKTVIAAEGGNADAICVG